MGGGTVAAIASDRLVTGMQFSADGRTLLTTASDGSTRLFDVGTQRELGNPLPGQESSGTMEGQTRPGGTACSLPSSPTSSWCIRTARPTCGRRACDRGRTTPARSQDGTSRPRSGRSSSVPDTHTRTSAPKPSGSPASLGFRLRRGLARATTALRRRLFGGRLLPSVCRCRLVLAARRPAPAPYCKSGPHRGAAASTWRSRIPGELTQMRVAEINHETATANRHRYLLRRGTAIAVVAHNRDRFQSNPPVSRRAHASRESVSRACWGHERAGPGVDVRWLRLRALSVMASCWACRVSLDGPRSYSRFRSGRSRSCRQRRAP